MKNGDQSIMDVNSEQYEREQSRAPQYTPGPWESKEFETGHIVIRCKHSPLLIAEMSQKLAPFEAEQKANAALIAAAPELLEALEGILSAFVHVEGDTKGNEARTAIFKYGQVPGGMAEAATKARAAIAKAKKGN